MILDLFIWGILVFWAVFRCLDPRVSMRRALAGAGAAGTLATILPPVSGFGLAVFAPFGFVLPALALRDLWARLGRSVVSFSTLEVSLLGGLTVVFLAASVGVTAFDPYRLGYGPVVPALLSLILLGWTLVRGHHALTVAVLLAQAAWTFGVTGSNHFDGLSHALIPFVCVVWLVKTLRRTDGGRELAKPAPPGTPTKGVGQKAP